MQTAANKALNPAVLTGVGLAPRWRGRYAPRHRRDKSGLEPATLFDLLFQ